MRRKKVEISRWQESHGELINVIIKPKRLLDAVRISSCQQVADVKLTPLAKRKEELAATIISQKVRRSNCDIVLKTFFVF